MIALSMNITNSKKSKENILRGQVVCLNKNTTCIFLIELSNAKYQADHSTIMR